MAPVDPNEPPTGGTVVNAKWSLIAMTALGSLTYAVIFIAQTQHEVDARAADEAGVDDVTVEREVEFVRDAEPAVDSVVDAAATLPTAEVSDLSDATPPEPAPPFEGAPWPAGVQAFEAGDYEVAAAALEVAVEEKETSPYRHYLLGLTYRRLGEVEGAVVELERSLELAPDAVRTLVNLGRAHLDLGDVESARMAVDRALDLDLEYGDTWHVLGRIELASGNLEEAEAAFRKATERDPEHAWALNNLGYVRIQREDFAAAIEPLRRALELGAEQAVFYNNLGVALERTERPVLAALAYARAAVLGHEDAMHSHERITPILVARGETVPGFDEAETLDAAAMVARVDAEVEFDVAVDEESAASPDETPVLEDLPIAFDEPQPNRR